MLGNIPNYAINVVRIGLLVIGDIECPQVIVVAATVPRRVIARVDRQRQIVAHVAVGIPPGHIQAQAAFVVYYLVDASIDGLDEPLLIVGGGVAVVAGVHVQMRTHRGGAIAGRVEAPAALVRLEVIQRPPRAVPHLHLIERLVIAVGVEVAVVLGDRVVHLRRSIARKIRALADEVVVEDDRRS